MTFILVFVGNSNNSRTELNIVLWSSERVLLPSSTTKPYFSSALQTSLQAENHELVPDFKSKLEKSKTGIFACVWIAIWFLILWLTRKLEEWEGNFVSNALISHVIYRLAKLLLLLFFFFFFFWWEEIDNALDSSISQHKIMLKKNLINTFLNYIFVMCLKIDSCIYTVHINTIKFIIDFT